MGRRRTLHVVETLERLEVLIQKESHAGIKDRLKLLYFYKQGKSVDEITEILLRDRSCLFRWLNYYNKSGLTQYMQSKTNRGPKLTFPEELGKELIKAWKAEKITSISKAATWVKQRDPEISRWVTKNFLMQHFYRDF